MLWFQTRHSKSSFLFPFLSRVWVLSRHIIGSAWFVFHWTAFSKVQTVIYLVSPIPRLARPSCQPPLHVKYQLRDRRTQTVAPVQESPPPGPVRRGRKDEKNTIDCLCFIRALQHWFDIREQRPQWHFRWQPRVLRKLACGYFFTSSPYLLYLTHS